MNECEHPAKGCDDCGQHDKAAQRELEQAAAGWCGCHCFAVDCGLGATAVGNQRSSLRFSPFRPPAATRARLISTLFRPAITESSGVSPSVVVAFTSAPVAKSILTILTCPQPIA